MNKEDRNSFRKEMLGKLEEQWAKSNSPEDDLFYYHPSEDKIVLSHALFWVMTQNIKGKVGKEKYLLLLRQYQEEMLEAYLTESQIQGAVDAAKNVDVIVACIGENSYTETPGNLTDLWLSENQRNLVKELAKTGKPVVLVLNEGRPRLIADIEPLAQGIIDILIPGNMGGDALVGLVSGKSNFSGKMPYTYPKEINSLANYDFKKSEEVGTMEGAYDYNAKITQQWGFGYGLSYTSYQYSNLKVSQSDFRHGDIIKVSVDVKNTGKVAGKESVLLFSSDLIASMVPDGRRLRAFDKIELQPGETKTVTFDLNTDDLAFVGYDGKWVLEEGDFKLMIADQTVNIHCEKTYQWQSANR